MRSAPLLGARLVVGVLVGAVCVQAQQPASSNLPRIPRRAAARSGDVEGIVRSDAGLGVGGARVVLKDGASGRTIEKLTTGDGVFLVPDVPPGTYTVTIEREGFEPLTANAQVTAGEVVPLELVMKAAPMPGPLDPGNPARNPELGPRRENPVIPEEQLSPYHNFPPNTVPEDLGPDYSPTAPIPGDQDVFVPVISRWGENYPDYKRYNMGNDTQYVKGHFFDPFNRNKLKGDYPIFGNSTFLSLTLTTDTFADGRRIPLPSGVSASRPDSANFFGKFGQFFIDENLSFSATLFHGDTSFKPVDWQIRFTPEVNLNYLGVKENGIVNIDVRKGTTRFDEHVGLQEAFAEVKLTDLSHSYDFVSVRAGIQSFNSDFRGFIFFDQEPGVRVFGNFGSNRYQYNLAAFAMLEKDTNSGLNTFNYRHQNVFIANLYRQDFLVPGYTIQASFHYDMDNGNSLYYNTDHFLVRPAPVGDVTPHTLRAYYYGLTGDGHIGRINVNHAFYQVLGTDKHNELAGKRVGINGQMAALELSLDKDWIRYRISGFYTSGDKNPRDGTAHGFDAIFDNPNFAGGIFSFWNREGIRLLGSGVTLVDGGSLIPSLRSSKIEGQASFVNPGIALVNMGADIDVTPKLRAFANLNLIRFVHPEILQLIEFQSNIHAGVGADSGIGVKYRPPLTDNIILTAGFNAFFPFEGFRDIYAGRTLYSLFTNVRFQF